MLNRSMKALPALLFKTDWSRNVRRLCTNGARSEPAVEEDTTQLVGSVGSDSVMEVDVEAKVVELTVAIEIVDVS